MHLDSEKYISVVFSKATLCENQDNLKLLKKIMPLLTKKMRMQ